MRILFIDRAHRGPAYDERTLAAQSLGGAESTLVRVAEALATKHEVFVTHAGREEDHRGGATYVGARTMERLAHEGVDVCVVQRKARDVLDAAERFPRARQVLWLHDYLAMKARFDLGRLTRLRCRIVAVSRTHAGHTAAVCGNGWRKAYRQRDGAGPAAWPVSSIPNPVDDALQPDGTPVDRDKLVFFSSPHKGLRQVLERFAEVRRRFPACRLYVANPGYRGLDDPRYAPVDAMTADGVEVVGQLPQSELIEHLRSALCVFYPQTVFPETFGLVYAEANAVGTPVLAHDFGAAAELLSPDQLVDGASGHAVTERVAAWRDQRPEVRLDERFRLSSVARDWDRFLQRLVEA